MRLHGLDLVGGELAGLEQDAVGNADFADVVQGARVKDRLDERLVDLVAEGSIRAELDGESLAVTLDPDDVIAGVVVADLAELGHREDGGHLRIRDLADLPEDPVVEGAVDLLDLALQAPDLEVRLDACLHLVELERLGHVVDAPDREALHLVDGFGVGADEEDWDVGQSRVGLERGAHLVSAHLRHVDVEQDDLGRRAARGRER